MLAWWSKNYYTICSLIVSQFRFNVYYTIPVTLSTGNESYLKISIKITQKCGLLFNQTKMDINNYFLNIFAYICMNKINFKKRKTKHLQSFKFTSSRCTKSRNPCN